MKILKSAIIGKFVSAAIKTQTRIQKMADGHITFRLQLAKLLTLPDLKEL